MDVRLGDGLCYRLNGRVSLGLLLSRLHRRSSSGRLSLFSLLLGLLTCLLSVLCRLLSSGLGRRLLLLLPDFLPAKCVLPLLNLGCRNLGEEMLRGSKLVTGLDGISDPGIGDERLGLNAELLEDSSRGVGQVRSDERGQKVDLVERKTDNGSAAVRLLSKKSVVELVVLEQLVAKAIDVISSRHEITGEMNGWHTQK